MERGGGGGGSANRYPRHAAQPDHAPPVPAAAASPSSGPASSSVDTCSPVPNVSTKIRLPANIRARDSPTSAHHQEQPRQAVPFLREQDQYMPIANVIRIMRRILPPHAKISDDAKETIQECVSEYISFVTGEANERCQREQRKTVTADDVLWAMGKLGFDNYVEPLSLFLSRYRETEGDRGSYRDPLLLKRSAADYGSMMMMPPPPPLQQQHQGIGYMQGGFQMQGGDHHGQGMFDAGGLNGGYYRDPFGSGSSSGGDGDNGGGTTQNEMANFNLYSQFK